MRWSQWVAWIAAAALTATATLPAAADVIYRRGLVGSPETLDPQKAATVTETPILLDLFEGLVTVDALGRTVPGAAQSWTISPDGLVYTFALREGARWSNGEVVKAADFVSSFRRLFDPETAATESGPLQVIKGAAAIQQGTAKPDTLGVKALDPATLEITLERPTPTFLGRLALPVALPVSLSAIRKLGADFGKTGKVVSNGPYRIAAFDQKDGTILVKNGRFRDADQIRIDSVIYRAFDNAGGCVDAYRAGDVQSCPDVPVEKLADLKAEFGPALHFAPYAGSYFFVFNTTKKPFDDPKVRQALSMSIDRTALAEQSWSGAMTPADTLLPKGLSTAPGTPETPIAARRAEAKALLNQAGFGSGDPKLKSLTVDIRVGTGTAHEQTARLVAEQWQTLGVSAKVEAEPSSSHYARLRDGGDFDVARAGWIVDEADPIDMLTLLRSDNVRFNYAHYVNPDFDKLLDAASVNMDATSRAKELADAEAILNRDAPVIPLFSYTSISLVAPGLSGWSDNLLNLHPTRFMALAE